MDSGLGPKPAGQALPLGTSAGQPDQAVEDGTIVVAGAARLLARLVDDQQGLQVGP